MEKISRVLWPLILLVCLLSMHNCRQRKSDSKEQSKALKKEIALQLYSVREGINPHYS